MLHTHSLDNLDNQTIMRILGYLAEDLQQELPDDAIIERGEDARAVITAVLEAAAVEGTNIAQTVPTEQEAEKLGHSVLTVFLNDETTQVQASELVANPPESRQMVVDPITGAIVLVALVTWLQTKVDIDLNFKNGKLDGTIKIGKPRTDKETLKDIIQTITKLLGGA